MSLPPPSLEDLAYSQFAWARYKKLMRWMVLVSAGAVLLAILFLRVTLGEVPVMMMFFTALGVFCSVLLAAALMGLVFLSSGSGHDEAVADPGSEEG
jgi:hypothetical protein